MKTKSFLFIIAAFFLSSAALGQIIHVPSDKPTIQDGINFASAGDTVLVDEGTYYENIRFFGKAITVASNYILDGDTNHINNTVIDGSQPVDLDKGSVVIFMNGEDTTSILNGFTIKGGSGLAQPNPYFGRLGGGIACFQSGAKIVNNKILNNEVTHSDNAAGAGICNFYDIGETWIVIENNTISGNTATAPNISAFGGGIYTGTNARIKNNIIKNNHCVSEFGNADGGGIESENMTIMEDTIYIVNNIISNNTVTAYNLARGAGICSFNSTLFIYGNTISFDSLSAERTNGCGIYAINSPFTEIIGNEIMHNTVDKIIIYWGVGTFIVGPDGPVIIRDNQYSNNVGEHTSGGAGGGLSVIDAYDVSILIEKNIFMSNSAYHGGGFYERDCYNLQLINNLFSENDSYRGGAIGLYHRLDASRDIPMSSKDPYPRIINNTFFSNSASDNAGAIRSGCKQIPPVIKNCIFYENEAPMGKDLYNLEEDTIVVSFSNLNTQEIGGNWKGEDNINKDPLFVNSGEHPFQINDYSPCIDAGTPDATGLNLPELDLAGEIRIDNYRVDMGAYEWNIFVGIGEPVSQASDLNVQTYPNPFTTSTTITYKLQQPATVQITIYNHLGEQVEVIRQSQSSGKQQVIWNAEGLASGVYLIVLKTNMGIQSLKLIKL